MKFQKIKIIALLLIVITLCGCNERPEPTDYTVQSRTVTIDNKQLYANELLTLIKTGETQSICIESFIFNELDIVSDAVMKQCYYFNGSIYMQISDTYMFRFQLDSENKVESYIKYSLEA